MVDTAAWLVDRVIPQVPVQQWVLSLPYRVRHVCAYDAGGVRRCWRPCVHRRGKRSFR